MKAQKLQEELLTGKMTEEDVRSQLLMKIFRLNQTYSRIFQLLLKKDEILFCDVRAS